MDYEEIGNFEGYRWVCITSELELKREIENTKIEYDRHLWDDLWQEWDMEGDRIFSMRNFYDDSFCTIVVASDSTIYQIKGENGQTPDIKYHKSIFLFLSFLNGPLEKNRDNEFFNLGLSKESNIGGKEQIPKLVKSLGYFYFGNLNLSFLEKPLLKGDLDLTKIDYPYLPPELTIEGDLIIKNGNLPKNLRIGRDLDLREMGFSGNISELPDTLHVGRNFYCSRFMKALPNSLYVGGDLIVANKEINNLDKKIIVKGKVIYPSEENEVKTLCDKDWDFYEEFLFWIKWVGLWVVIIFIVSLLKYLFMAISS